MKLETAKLLKAAANHAGIDLEINEDYSGRGMYGRTTTAIEVESSNDIFAILAVFVDESFDIDHESNLVEADRYEAMEDIASIKSDSLGRQVIFY